MKRNIFLATIIVLLSIFSCYAQTEKDKDLLKETNVIPNFNLQPTKPINGKLKGVVELGASSFNSFIINVDKNLNWELKKNEFGASAIAEGETDLNKVSKKLKSYIQKIIDYGVVSENIHFVVSSGAIKEEITKTIVNELEKIGYHINIVTPEEEGIYALKAVLLKRFNNIAFVVDIGSGNTKISFFDENNNIKAIESYGAKYFQKNITDSIVYNDIKFKTITVPTARTSYCFMMGGVAYKLAKSVRKGKEKAD